MSLEREMLHSTDRPVLNAFTHRWHLSRVTIRNLQAAKWAVQAGDSSEEVSPGLPELARDLGEHQS